MLQILVGDESYKIELLLSRAKKGVPENDIKVFTEFNQSLISFTQGLFMDKRVAIVKIGKLEALESSVFADYKEVLLSDTLVSVIVVASSYDKRRNFVKELLEQEYVRKCERCKNKQELVNILLYELKARNSKITTSAMDLFIERTSYLEDDSVNLYQVVNALYDLCDLSNAIDEKLVSDVIPNNVYQNTFAIAKFLMNGDISSIKKQSAKMLENGTTGIAVLSALLREIQIAWKSEFYSNGEIGIYYNAVMASLSRDELSICMEIVMRVIDGIKAGKYADKDALMIAVYEIYDKIIKKEIRECV